MDDFSVKTYVRNQVQCFELEGTLHAASSEKLSKAVDEFIQSDQRNPVILYLADLDYVSSAGLREIFKLIKYCQMYDLKIIAHKTQPSVAKVFEIIQMIPHLSMFEDESLLDKFIEELQNKHE